MKRLFTYLLAATMFFVAGCSEGFDDSAIWEKLNSLDSRVTALEQLCRQMNTNISSLQTIVDALQNKDYVTNVTPITEDGKVIGYTITFSKSGSITIYHGKDGQNGQDGADGKDGYTPVIGIAKDTDGIYYWTLDGDWLLDKDGNKVKSEGVDGKDGADGKDGVTPKLKIEDDYWYISYDNGTTWTKLGKATSEDGDSMFQDITYDDDYVYITLINGLTLTVPRYFPKPKSNQIWYTTNSTTIALTFASNDIINSNGLVANITSNEYDAEKGHWVITFDSDITLIGNSAFYYCRPSPTSITIPNSVTSIGYGAFKDCSSLTSITIPNSVTSIGVHAFDGCRSLTSIIIPDSVTSIGEYAFSKCHNLTSITISNNITSAGKAIFYKCYNLTNIYGKYASNDNRCLIINGKLIGFAQAGLTTYTIPNDVSSIEFAAFAYCSNLTSITIPNSVTKIEGSAFSSCTNLTNITIPNSVTSIGVQAFYGCTSLTSIIIPDSVTKIESEAFERCSSLANIYCKPTTPPIVGESMFSSNNSLHKIYVPTSSVDAYKTADGWRYYADIIEGYNFE